jgi:hypothetical protein
MNILIQFSQRKVRGRFLKQKFWLQKQKNKTGLTRTFCFPSSKTSRKSGDQSIRPAIGQSRYEHRSYVSK